MGPSAGSFHLGTLELFTAPRLQPFQWRRGVLGGGRVERGLIEGGVGGTLVLKGTRLTQAY